GTREGRADGRRGERVRRRERERPAVSGGPEAGGRAGPTTPGLPEGPQRQGGRPGTARTRASCGVQGEPHARDPVCGAGECDARRDQRRAPIVVRHVPGAAGAMTDRAHHVGIAVKRLEDGLALYRTLGLEPESVEDVPTE